MKDEFEGAKGKVFVSVYPSNLKDKDGNKVGKCVGKIRKNVASTRQLAARAKKGGIVLSEETLLYAADVLSKAARDALSEGLAVDLLGLGTLGFSVEGSVDQFMTALEISGHFRLAFTPSKEAEKALKNILPSRIVLQSSRIYISEVRSLAAESAEKNTVYLNRPLRIKGNGLKVGGEVCGVFLVPCRERAECVEAFSEAVRVRRG